jgi:hypothetical protein
MDPLSQGKRRIKTEITSLSAPCRREEGAQTKFAGCGDIHKYPQGLALSSNCYGAVVEPWDGRRAASCNFGHRTRIAEQVDRRARATSKAAMARTASVLLFGLK